MLSTKHSSARSLVACNDCGALYQERPLLDGASAQCPRCGAVLYAQKRDSLDRTLTLTLAGLVLFVLANAYPFMSFELEGRTQHNTLITGVVVLYNHGLWTLAAVVFGASILAPFLKLLGSLYVLLPLKLGRRPWKLALVFRWVQILRPWAMTEVYLLGVLVAYVKLSDFATVKPDIASYCFATLIVVMAAADASLDPRIVWNRLGRPPRVSSSPVRARGWLVGCHTCGLVSRYDPLPADGHVTCSRCGAALHRRKPDSLNRTWALVLSALVFYVPANIFPVMTVISFGKGEPDTILSGVQDLIHNGMWPLALLIFFASITVPVLKLVGLSYLLISVQCKSQWRPKDRTRLYRITETVGRWSMIDIFMISIVVALVNLGSIATINPGVGATSFAAVVIITMIAATSFDPRLIWDALEIADGRSTRRTR